MDREHAEIATVARLTGAAPADDRPRLFADLARAFPLLDVASLSSRPASAVNRSNSVVALERDYALGDGYQVFPLGPEGNTHRVGIVLPDGTMLSAKIRDQYQPPFWGGPLVTTLLFAFISVTLLGMWAARALTAPLSSFAKAAESFSLNSTVAPLPEQAPRKFVRLLRRSTACGNASPR